MRATRITFFLENDGELETAQRIAAHSDSRTTKHHRLGLFDELGKSLKPPIASRV